MKPSGHQGPEAGAGIVPVAYVLKAHGVPNRPEGCFAYKVAYLSGQNLFTQKQNCEPASFFIAVGGAWPKTLSDWQPLARCESLGQQNSGQIQILDLALSELKAATLIGVARAQISSLKTEFFLCDLIGAEIFENATDLEKPALESISEIYDVKDKGGAFGSQSWWALGDLPIDKLAKENFNALCRSGLEFPLAWVDWGSSTLRPWGSTQPSLLVVPSLSEWMRLD